MRTRFKSLLALGLTFAAGCFVGIVIGSSNPRWFKSFRQPPGPDRAVEHLTEVLELTPEQQEQVREVFIRLHPEFLKESERAKAFRRAFIIKHFNEMAPAARRTPEGRGPRVSGKAAVEENAASAQRG